MENKKITWILLGAVGALTALLDGYWRAGQDMSLLFTLTFWMSLVQGCIALVAAVETAGAKWLDPIKKQLLSVYPILLLGAFLFIFLGSRMDFYPWMKHPGKWLDADFFLGRNIIMLLVTFMAAYLFSKATLKESNNSKFFAVLYLFVYVTEQSLVAFDWIMPLEYPWISTLFGPYFFIEALYLAMAFSLIYMTYLRTELSDAEFTVYKNTQRDVATLMFGFSLLWAGFFFSQYLVIWYGHIPEENAFIIHRLAHSPIREMAIALVPVLFVVPFTSLIPKKSKNNAPLLLFLATIVFVGIMMERIVMMAPLVPLNTLVIALEFLGFAVVFVKLVGTSSTSSNLY